MPERDISTELQARVSEAFESRTRLCIRGGNSKAFYGRAAAGEPLDVNGHTGIVNYEPTELSITARAGTPLREIEAILAQHNQMLAFEPPHFGDGATLGGTIACNLSGPRRPHTGAARDFVLGTKVLNGKGEMLSFGGEVMKNVAGYDVSRLMSGALGTLGVLLEVSLKLLPRPDIEITLRRESDVREALESMHDWAGKPYPVSATCCDGDSLYVRLSGEERAVRSACQRIGGDEYAQGEQFWHRLREQQHGFFNTDRPLWRLSIASDTAPVDCDGKWLYEWGGAQRWLVSATSAGTVQTTAARAGGHATLYRNGGERDDIFQPLSPGLMNIHRRLKQAFDPGGILNPGRLYRDL